MHDYWHAISFPMRGALPFGARNVRYSSFYYLTVVAVFCAVPGRQIRREMLITAGSIVIIGNLTPVLFFLGVCRYTQFYRDVEEHGWTYFYAPADAPSPVVSLVSPTHHRSTNPNPWTTYSLYSWYTLFSVRMMGTPDPQYADRYRQQQRGL